MLGIPLITVQAQGQSRGSAAAPTTSLADKFVDHFPNAKNMAWLENSQGYQVTFLERNLTMTAQYGPNEIWQHTNIVLPKSMVPEEALAHFESNYANKAILATGYHDSSAQSFYKIEANINGKRRTLKYDDNGKFLGVD